MDVSADLTELGRTRVSVVCAGVKSLLDIPRTLEYLETQGVPVVTLGSEEFPAFFTRSSGSPSPMVAESAVELGAMVHHQRRLGLCGGMLFAVPIPAEEAARGDTVEAAIHRALREAREQGVAGKDITPFLLGRINELTGGVPRGQHRPRPQQRQSRRRDRC